MGTFDADLLAAVEKAVKRLGTTRSASARRALREAFAVMRAQLERKHREGHARKRARRGEFGPWETEQVWTD